MDTCSAASLSSHACLAVSLRMSSEPNPLDVPASVLSGSSSSKLKMTFLRLAERSLSDVKKREKKKETCLDFKAFREFIDEVRSAVAPCVNLFGLVLVQNKICGCIFN